VPVQYSAVRSGPQHVLAHGTKSHGPDTHYFLLSLQTRGQGVLEQDGRRAVLQTGDFALYDTTRPYDLWFDAQFSQLVLRLRARWLPNDYSMQTVLPHFELPAGVGAGRLASLFFVSCTMSWNGSSPAAWTGSMPRVRICSQTAICGADRGTIIRQRIACAAGGVRICDFIDRHLCDPDLSCLSIASAHGISERYLRKLFARSSTSASDPIWTRRLERGKARFDRYSAGASHGDGHWL